MKRSRFTEEQIIGIPRKQGAGLSTADVVRKHSVSSATFYEWKATYSGMDVFAGAQAEGARGRECAAEAAAG